MVKERHQRGYCCCCWFLHCLLFLDSHFLQQQVIIIICWASTYVNLILEVPFSVSAKFCRLYKCKSQFNCARSLRSKSEIVGSVNVAYRTIATCCHRRWQKTSLNYSLSLSLILSFFLFLLPLPLLLSWLVFLQQFP